jgi:hypothetical protein
MTAESLNKARRRFQGGHRAIQMSIHNLSGIFEIPQSGARLYSVVGKAKTVASILLAPGDGLNRKRRRFAERHEFIGCSVRADLGRPISPDAFHRTTLLWALYSADLIHVWSAPFSQRSDDLGRDALADVNTGSRFLTTIETTEPEAPAWLRYVERWKQSATPVRVYGPEIMEAVR